MESVGLPPRELLALQGFPAYPALEARLGCPCSFSFPRDGRQRNKMMEQAGNAFHIEEIGIVLAWYLTYVDSKNKAGILRTLRC